ncbi:response regulator transcription factor [Caballeronia sp. AZ10_KS36]|uniref:response regulator n=1 Tax=Caballeronia sp. AZ10_KS36 TaxID=2921757 RepID=UPI00202824E0|nr:response regulator transcription factor [Caballeronia sp. AZ10_KS36]
MHSDAPLNVLLLEDEGIQRAGTKALIQMAAPRAQIQEAGSYQEAINRLAESCFHIAFLDYNLRDQHNGLDVLKAIRRMEVDTRAIILSSHREREIILACIDAGASGYITKEMDATGVFEKALQIVFEGGIFLPATALGRGAFSPNVSVPPMPTLTDSLGLHGRKLEALYYLCQGLPNKLIARKMGVAEDTVRKDYNPSLFRLFGVTRRTELILEVSRRNLIVPKPKSESEHNDD